MEYKRLEQSLIDIVKEEQAKLGYRKEDVRLYYPLSTLNHFFDTEDTVEEMAERLTHLPEDMKARLGEIAVTHKKDRFCFHIPEQGSEYVHEHTAENEFIKELIELVREHGCTKKKILELFGQYSENTITEETVSDICKTYNGIRNEPIRRSNMEEYKNGKIERVLGIYTKLLNGYIVNKAAEANEYRVNERSIQRDVDVLWKKRDESGI